MAIASVIKDIFRAGSPATAAIELLGLLHNLPGSWGGNGFNLIARPAKADSNGQNVFFLELNGTQENLDFVSIAGDIPNRGDVEPTSLLHGVHYLQTVRDCEDKAFIHKEPGIWIHVLPTQENPKDTYVRLATIPHGDSLVAQSTFSTDPPIQGPPRIDPVDSFPISINNPIPPLNDVTHAVLGGNYVTPYTTTPLPPDCLPRGLDAAKTIKDPTEVLRAQIASQTIKETAVIVISTVLPTLAGPVPLGAPTRPGGIINIPFVVKNANASQMDAIFWIEKVQHPTFPDREYMQLQYVQRVILDFAGVHWPHISVATLVKSA
jgi:hypothetical protein